jgi:gliding motility associated protien GldN
MAQIKWQLIGLMLFLPVGLVMAQEVDNMSGGIMTESGEIIREQPIDDITERKVVYETQVLPYDPVREADIFWEKRIWRVIDTRELMNLRFRYPDRPLISIILDAAEEGEITVYSGEDDKFSDPLSPEEVSRIGSTVDTTYVMNPETYETTMQVVANELDPAEVVRYRIKEIWFFDKSQSTMRVRILGIAPLVDKKDENGNFKYELPLFWVYYPEARKVFARERVFNGYNDASPMSWEALFEMRFFSSYIWKESNVFDRKIEEYVSGVDVLMESERIKNELFSFEHDLWSY